MEVGKSKPLGGQDGPYQDGLPLLAPTPSGKRTHQQMTEQYESKVAGKTNQRGNGAKVDKPGPTGTKSEINGAKKAKASASSTPSPASSTPPVSSKPVKSSPTPKAGEDGPKKKLMRGRKNVNSTEATTVASSTKKQETAASSSSEYSASRVAEMGLTWLEPRYQPHPKLHPMKMSLSTANSTKRAVLQNNLIINARGYNLVRANYPVQVGKWYYEAIITDAFKVIDEIQTASPNAYYRGRHGPREYMQKGKISKPDSPAIQNSTQEENGEKEPRTDIKTGVVVSETETVKMDLVEKEPITDIKIGDVVSETETVKMDLVENEVNTDIKTGVVVGETETVKMDLVEKEVKTDTKTDVVSETETVKMDLVENEEKQVKNNELEQPKKEQSTEHNESIENKESAEQKDKPTENKESIENNESAEQRVQPTENKEPIENKESAEQKVQPTENNEPTEQKDKPTENNEPTENKGSAESAEQRVQPTENKESAEQKDKPTENNEPIVQKVSIENEESAAQKEQPTENKESAAQKEQPTDNNEPIEQKENAENKETTEQKENNAEEKEQKEQPSSLDTDYAQFANLVTTLVDMNKLGDGSRRTLPGPHWRLGWATEQADSETPAGTDSYGFCWRDTGTLFHQARPLPVLQTILKPGVEGPVLGSNAPSLHQECDSYAPGDVLGFGIELPPENMEYIKQIHQHQERVLLQQELVHNILTGLTAVPEKEKQELMKPIPPPVLPKILPGTKLSFWKNGVLQAVYIADIPPGSYYPAISAYYQAGAVVNFGPSFHFAPPDGFNACSGLPDAYQMPLPDSTYLPPANP